MQDKLVFVISPPRGGSTLLQRMLGSHSQIMTHPEPHLITPLAYLGFYDIVDKAPFDHINSAEALRLFVNGLPHGEQDYLDALRAYTDTLYGRMLRTSDRQRFVDKTPAYALVLPFLSKLYPNARYVVLTRHPLAVMSSYANSFFNGDWRAALDFNPIIERYVPAMARFLRERPAALLHVRYEELVASPEEVLAEIFAFLQLPNEPQAVNYGQHFEGKSGPGDPITVAQHQRPTTASLDKWANELASDPEKRELAETIISRLAPQDLETWGYPKADVLEALAKVSPNGRPSRRPSLLNSYTLQRRIFLALRKDIHNRPLGKAVKKVRYYCDVLLRE